MTSLSGQYASPALLVLLTLSLTSVDIIAQDTSSSSSTVTSQATSASTNISSPSSTSLSSTTLRTTTIGPSWPASGSNFPDPRSQPSQCGMTRPSYVCNPDNVITQSQALSLDNRIMGIARGSPCMCDCTLLPPCGYRCNARPSRRFSVALAVVPSLSPSYPGQTPSQKLEEFARALRGTRWTHYGDCQNTLVVALSQTDRQVFTATGRYVRDYAISDNCLRDINDKVRPILTQGRLYEGLNEFLDYYRNALQGGRCGTKAGLSAAQIAGIVVGVIAAVVAIIGLIVCCVGFCQSWECVVDTCIGVCIGAVLLCIQSLINSLIVSCCQAMCESCGCDPDVCQCEPLSCVDPEDDGGGGAGTGY